jgi:hypothetical protein
MRRLYAWLAGAAGGLATYGALKRRHPAAEPVPEAAPDPRADELRARLAEALDVEEPAADGEPLDPDARRRLVHEQARATLEEMGGE